MLKVVNPNFLNQKVMNNLAMLLNQITLNPQTPNFTLSRNENDNWNLVKIILNGIKRTYVSKKCFHVSVLT